MSWNLIILLHVAHAINKLCLRLVACCGLLCLGSRVYSASLPTTEPTGTRQLLLRLSSLRFLEFSRRPCLYWYYFVSPFAIRSYNSTYQTTLRFYYGEHELPGCVVWCVGLFLPSSGSTLLQQAAKSSWRRLIVEGGSGPEPVVVVGL